MPAAIRHRHCACRGLSLHGLKRFDLNLDHLFAVFRLWLKREKRYRMPWVKVEQPRKIRTDQDCSLQSLDQTSSAPAYFASDSTRR